MHSSRYWERRYARGGTSGAGSEGKAARVKAGRVNQIIKAENVRSVIDWGCGDGTVLSYLVPNIDYVGVDVSSTIVKRLSLIFAKHRFYLNDAPEVTADLALSLDVLFHLPEDDDYNTYLDRLFGSATRLVLIQSFDHDAPKSGHHIRKRHFTTDVSRRFEAWTLERKFKGRPPYYLYRRTTP